MASCAILILFATAALANPMPTGTLSFLNNNGTVSGSFSISNGTFTAWNFNLTASGAGGSGAPARDYTSTDASAAGSILSNSNNDEVFSFSQNFADGLTEFDIVINCHGTADCVNFAAVGTSYEIVGGIPGTCPAGNLCIPSADQRVVGVGGLRYLDSGFFNVTDPAVGVSLNIDSVATGTVYNGGNGVGSSAPEPSSLLLLGTGLLSAGRLHRRFKLHK